VTNLPQSITIMTAATPVAASGDGSAVAARHQHDFVTSLESMRGVAALMVLLQHACVNLAGPNWSLLKQTVWGLSDDDLLHRCILALLNGNAAVSFFFVLSGFVLALSLRRDVRAVSPKAAAFTGRRLMRIYPALVANLLVMAVLLWLFMRIIPGVAWQVPTWQQLYNNLLLIDFEVNGPTWTMLVELLAVPLLLVSHLIAMRFGIRGLLAMLAISVAALFAGRAVHRLLPGEGLLAQVVYAFLVDYQFMFVLGMLIAEIGVGRRTRIAPAAAAACLMAAVMALLSARALFGFLARPALLIEAAAAGTIVGVLAFGPRLRGHDVLESGPLRFLGRVSYSFYLYHTAALAIVAPSLAVLMTNAWQQEHPYWTAAATSGLSLAVTVPLAWISYALVERPAIQVGRRF
jgi:peptidoglycan/LPS O-acetylase OafA/YrhL